MYQVECNREGEKDDSLYCKWIGASGARITYSLALEMQKRSIRYGIASLCIGGGQGIAILLENPTV